MKKTLSREFKGHNIRVHHDGYIHATDMCKVGGKGGWKNYNQRKQTKLFIKELVLLTGYPVNKLTVVKWRKHCHDHLTDFWTYPPSHTIPNTPQHTVYRAYHISNIRQNVHMSKIQTQPKTKPVCKNKMVKPSIFFSGPVLFLSMSKNPRFRHNMVIPNPTHWPHIISHALYS